MLEDCLTFELILCNFAELVETEMRIVKPSTRMRTFTDGGTPLPS